MQKISNILKTIAKILISLAFLSVLLSFVQGNELLAVFKNINWPWFMFSLFVTLVMLAASCAKWKIILDLKGKPLSYWELLKIYMIGYFFSNILPSTVGGDVVRSYYAGRLIENQSYAAVSVFVERFSGIFFLFLLVGIAPFFYIEVFGNPYVFVPAAGGLACAIITLWIFLARNPFALPNRLATGLFSSIRQLSAQSFFAGLARPLAWTENFYARALDRLKKLKAELQIAGDAVKNNRPFMRQLVFLTVLFYTLAWVNVYTAFKAFNVDVNFLAICALVPAIMFVAHVPVTLLGNIGYYESVFVFYFLFVGVEGAESLAMGLFLRVKMLGMGGIGFISYLVYRQSHRLPPAKEDFSG